MKPFTTVTDPVFVRPAHYNFLDRFFLKLIRDERDLPFVYLTLQITLLMLPAGLLLYLPLANWLWWALATLYFILNNFVYKGSFGLMLHCTSHRRLYKQRYNFLNLYLPWVIGPFFGQTPETYFSHHIGMHHVENNLENDLSTTMHYQRDSWQGFVRYLGSFLFLGAAYLVNYFRARNIKKLRDKVIRGELVFLAFCVVLCFVDWQATFVVFILPFLISRLIMMVGNWAQHAFVDYDEPGNCYKNSLTCINTKYNHKCWNDGYHISHHLKPTLHWTQYPAHFQENLQEFATNKALVFEGIHWLHIWLYLMTKNYRLLSAHLVNIHHAFSSEEEAIALMRSRTSKMPARGISMKSLRMAEAP
ncbi:fatty acid desaturase family protein [Pontibacter liquoris]|uniref:fatty acid desaturase family protein n=1 Tax=Pontibacter liquoris TaxID=2905677 RepID=UPI001FA728EB|nr:fatty acid desaturase [Pontibacter liquoris]